ncbi:MAG TPA: pyrroloquinoline quinone-dependent dehydrogenase [Vicinamibacterales bacterium]|nr:pyrroloquinoline quinone-dependent dehydrogenase [Vicinamibacterales bacterium]
MKLNLVAALLAAASLVAAYAQQRTEDGDWPMYGRDPGAQRFSPLTQITRGNVEGLQQAWAFDTGAKDLQVTPIVVDSTMYLTGGTRVFALEPETGKPIWTYEADAPVARRGVAYWRGTSKIPPRIFLGVGDGRMIALDARTGEVAAAFGKGGIVDLKEGVRGDVDGRLALISPPAIYQDIIITGGSNSENEPSTGVYGDIRGWDAISGKLRWSFHTVPRPGEPGAETWDGESWRNRSGTNAWSYLTVDLERGIVFAPTGSPTSDFYGADRRGKNLYANSLIALDARTGRLKWFQQLVHHDLWDYDLPAAPTLIEVAREGRKILAVAMMTKMSTLFIFNRETGEPIYGMEERQVRASTVPGEAAWPTQPFPKQPPPLARTTFDPRSDFYTLTPEHEAYCKELWQKHGMYAAPLFTPPAIDGTMVMFPSTLGGGNWSGLSYDASRGFVYTNIMNLGQVARMERRTDPATGPVTYKRTGPWGSPYGRFWNPQTKVPCSAPPFGELVAVDVNTAEIVWRVPLGVFDELAARGFPKTGAPNIGGTIATASGIVFIGATIDGRFRAFDAGAGTLLWETRLEASAHATPMSFMGRDGRQYVVIAAGGNGLLASPPGSKVVAFALPTP